LLQDYFYIDYASALNVINIPNVNVNKLIESIINYDYEKNISLKDNPKQIKKYAYYRAALKAPNGSISEENQMKLVDNLVCLTKNITYSKAIERWHRLNNMQKACA